MRSNKGNGNRAAWARGIAALWVVLAPAAGGSALAAPTLTVLYSFKGGSDGSGLRGGLIADSSGNLYGTTTSGGAPGCFGGIGCGTVFKLTPGGTETVLHTFTGVPATGVIPQPA